VPSLDHDRIILNGKVSVVELTGFTEGSLGAKCPSFQTNESLFLEELPDHGKKGLWLPGLKSHQPSSGKPIPTRLAIVLIAEKVAAK